MIFNGETEIEIIMNTPRVDIAESHLIGEFWIFVN
jgi:hypothetical protein